MATWRPQHLRLDDIAGDLRQHGEAMKGTVTLGTRPPAF